MGQSWGSVVRFECAGRGPRWAGLGSDLAGGVAAVRGAVGKLRPTVSTLRAAPLARCLCVLGVVFGQQQMGLAWAGQGGLAGALLTGA